ncbi:MAG: group 1 truncated hemoglobin [Ignavibacteriae bacterium]|nr:group 1 truncated hemoglobin [Ignavibacteriota bacterium]
MMRVAIFAAVCIGMLAPVDAFAQAKKQGKSLYDRLGGVYAIAAVVDDFIDRVVANDILNANPAIKEARDRVPAAGLKYRVTEMVCMATGGPCKYTGRSMKESHKHLNITEKEWDALVVNFKESLAKFNVPEKEQNELLTIVGSTKGDIVTVKTMQ